MDQACLMDIVDSKQDLPNKISSVTLCKVHSALLDLIEHLKQVAFWKDLEHDVDVLVVFKQIKSANDVWMAYLLKDCQLLLHQSCVDFSFVDFCLLNYFYSTLFLNLQVCSKEYFAKLTRAKLFLERVQLVHVVNLVEAFELLKLHEA